MLNYFFIGVAKYIHSDVYTRVLYEKLTVYLINDVSYPGLSISNCFKSLFNVRNCFSNISSKLLLNSNINIHRKYNPCIYPDSPDKLVKDIIDIKKTYSETSNDIYNIGEHYLDLLYNHSIKQSPSQILNDKISHILETRFNYDIIKPTYNDFTLSNNTSKHINIFDKFPLDTNRQILDLWFTYCKFDLTTYNLYTIPYSFQYKNCNYEYEMLRTSCVLFDKSYSLRLRLYGKDVTYVLEQILSCSVSKMDLNDVKYGCLLDSKCIILDTCYVCKYDGEYLVVTNGTNKRCVYDYISSYVIHCRNHGLDVFISHLSKHIHLCIYGPSSYNILNNVSNNELLNGINIPSFMKTVFKESNNDSARIYCNRISDVGEDGFDIILPLNMALKLSRLLFENESCKLMGFKTYDVARLESGIIRSDVDLPTESSPMNASLMWCVDLKKIRNKILFGYNTIGREMANNVLKLRVGLVSNNPLTLDTIILNSSRKPIGFVTSTVWSDSLQMYISHAYVDNDYAKHGMPVILSIPKSPPKIVSRRLYKRYYANKLLKSFSRGIIVRLPFILHKYPIDVVNIQEDDTSNELQVFKNDEYEKQRIKSKKEIWKNIISNKKRKTRGTLNIAMKRWEDKNRISRSNAVYCGVNNTVVIPHDRINLITKRLSDPENIISHYQYLNSIPIPPRHQRYRPPMVSSS